jgi:predicted CXXCH cytochrome family protein
MSRGASFALMLAMSCAAVAQEYVGSAACGGCHRAIYESYRKTPMALSSAPPGGGIAHETFGKASFTDAKSGWRYRLGEVAALTLEFDRAADGAHGTKKLAYAIGSGATARSYLIEDDGFLFEAPVAYYARGAMWALEPGYADYDYPYLTRPIPPTCLSCHASFLRVVSGTLNRYDSAPFGEGGVACERCHGAGGDHIARMKAGKARDGSGIVNPAKLDAVARDSVCQQCHLNGEARVFRNSKDWRSYRPGERLSDSMTVFVRESGAWAAQVTSHAEDLARSGCQRGAGARLWCGSCHDPHNVPATAEKAQWYRAKCEQCHSPEACTAPIAARARTQDNCIGCHMPKTTAADAAHVVATDHSIPRRPRAPQGAAASTGLMAFGGAAASERDLGLAYAIAAPHQSSGEFRARAMALLERATRQSPEDPEALTYLAELYRNSGRSDRAGPLYRRAIQLDPAQLTAAVGLGGILMERGEYGEAIRLWRGALEENSGLELVRCNLALALWKTGDVAGARATLEKALSLSPAFAPARQLLQQTRPAQ